MKAALKKTDVAVQTPDQAQTQSQHNLAALLTAAGVSPKKICVQLGMSKAKYTLFLQSGVFNSLTASYRKRILEKTLDDAATTLLGDAKANVDFLKRVRDGHYDDLPAPVVGNRLRASHILADRQFPKTSEGINEHLVSDALRKIANAVCGEIGEPIEVEATDLDKAIEDLTNNEDQGD
jgi:transcriptional regulator with XRE-family HTH domain